MGINDRKGRWEFLTSTDQRPHHYVIASLIQDYFANGAHVLDVGCGLGGLCKLLPASTTRSYKGIDIAKNAIERCRKTFAKDPEYSFECISFEHFESTDRFNVIIFNDILHDFDLKLIAESFEKATTLLKEGDGVIVVSMIRNLKTWFVWHALETLARPEHVIEAGNPATGSQWTIKAFRPAAKLATQSLLHNGARSLAMWFCDLNIRFNMEATFLRRNDPWKYAVSGYEQDRFTAMWAAVKDRQFDDVLEVGPGEGLFTKRLASISTRLTCLDISQTALSRTRLTLEEARSQDPGKTYADATFVRANMRVWSPGQGRFDLMVMGDVLYYMEATRKLSPFLAGQAKQDLAQRLAQFVSWLKPGGLLLLCHGFGQEFQKQRLQLYRNIFEANGVELLHETVGEPSDKGVTRYLLSLLRRKES